MNTDFTKSIEELHREAIGEAPAELMTEGEYREYRELDECSECDSETIVRGGIRQCSTCGRPA